MKARKNLAQTTVTGSILLTATLMAIGKNPQRKTGMQANSKPLELSA